MLHHVTVTFRPGEESKLREFYVGLIGLKEKPVPKSVQSFGWIWFFTANDGVEFHCVPDPEPIPEKLPHHLCFHVANLADYKARLASAGFEVREVLELPLRPRFFTRDPFGNSIEMVSVEGDYLKIDPASEVSQNIN